MKESGGTTNEGSLERPWREEDDGEVNNTPSPDDADGMMTISSCSDRYDDALLSTDCQM
jgi:hypothetical protein